MYGRSLSMAYIAGSLNEVCDTPFILQNVKCKMYSSQSKMWSGKCKRMAYIAGSLKKVCENPFISENVKCTMYNVKCKVENVKKNWLS